MFALSLMFFINNVFMSLTCYVENIERIGNQNFLSVETFSSDKKIKSEVKISSVAFYTSSSEKFGYESKIVKIYHFKETNDKSTKLKIKIPNMQMQTFLSILLADNRGNNVFSVPIATHSNRIILPIQRFTTAKLNRISGPIFFIDDITGNSMGIRLNKDYLNFCDRESLENPIKVGIEPKKIDIRF